MDSKKWMIIKNIDSYAVVISVVAGQCIIFLFRFSRVEYFDIWYRMCSSSQSVAELY